MYFALFDQQTGYLMESGRNSTTLRDIQEALLSYLSIDHTEKELDKLRKLDISQFVGIYEFEILKQSKKFAE